MVLTCSSKDASVAIAWGCRPDTKGPTIFRARFWESKGVEFIVGPLVSGRQPQAMATLASLEEQVKTMQADYNESLDTIWMLLAGILVFFMHAGFGLLEAGCVRAKNMTVLTSGFLCWYVFGWPLAYGPVEDPNKFSGGTGFVMDGFWETKANFRNWFFQGAFCATAGTIVSGAMAERTQLKGFAIYTCLMTSFIYPIAVYWGWSGSGFLSYTDDHGKSVSAFGPWYKDFAGSGLVHMVGGVGALCGCVIVGPRKGRFDPQVDQAEFTAHSIPFVVLGTMSLWFGWYGFNAGSTLSMHDVGAANSAGLVAVNTTLAPCVGGLLVFFMRAKLLPPYLLDVGGFCNGMLAGLVSITAGCGFVEPWETIIIAMMGACVYQGASMAVVKLKIDDVVDAFAVHGACGLWGVLALGIFGEKARGIGGNRGRDQLGVQIMAGVILVLWVGGLSIAIFLPLKLARFLRLSDDFQVKGADIMEHSPPKAYNEKPGQPSVAVVPP